MDLFYWMIFIVILLCDYFGMDVLANVCYLSQQRDPHQGGKLRWVMPVEYKDRCTCTIFKPGGWNMNPPLRSYSPYFIDQPLFIYPQSEIFKMLHCSVELSIIGKPTEQSSTYRSQYSSSKAVDGIGVTATNNGDCTFTSDDGEIDPWWRVDLEEEHCIGMITVINRVYCCSNRLTHGVARAGLSANITNNKKCGSPVTAEQAEPLGGVIEFECDPPLRARYVGVDIPTSKLEKLHLCEVMVKEFPLAACNEQE